MPYKNKEDLKEFRKKYQATEKYKEYKRKYYLKNREKYLEVGLSKYAKRKLKDSGIKKKTKKARDPEDDRKRRALQQRKHYANNQEKCKARYILRHAINYHKTLKREDCHCGKIGEAHHPDYSKPLEVEWLCRKHHMEKHRKTYVETGSV